MMTCKVCGCTTKDCRQCIERTGEPCYWIGPNLCSACADPSLLKPKKEKKENRSIAFLVLQKLFLDMKLATPIPEYKFSNLRRWKFDYAWPTHKVSLEMEGGIWMKGGGAHSRPGNIMRDIEKYNAAIMLGWKVIRCTPQTVHSEETIDMIKQLLTEDLAYKSIKQ